MKRRRNIIIIVVAVLAVVLIGAFVSRPRNDAIAVRMQTITLSSFQTRLPESGTLQRPLLQTLSAMVAGNLAGFAVSPGQHVDAGAVVARIANPQIENASATAYSTYVAAAARAQTASQTSTLLPLQNRSAVVQAEAALEQARFNYNQAVQDVSAGSQSGLGYGGTSASEQRAVADAAVANATTVERESARIYRANQDLFNNKAISRDALEQSRAKNEQDEVNLAQLKSQRDETYASLKRQSPVLSDRVRAARDSVRQAEAALSSARATAAQPKTGDAAAAQADAAARKNDWQYAADQAARLQVRAPFSGTVASIATQSGDSMRPLQPGDAVTAGQMLVTLASERNYVVRTKVDEQDIASVRIGQRAVVSGEDLAGKTLPGHVVAINEIAQKSDDVSNTSRQVITTVQLDRSLPFLRDGMTLDVDIITRELPHVIVVGNDAIRRDPGDKPYVYVVHDGRTVKTPISVGPSNETQTVVTRGLTPGMVIVNDRNAGITPNAAVTPAAVTTPLPQSSGAGA